MINKISISKEIQTSKYKQNSEIEALILKEKLDLQKSKTKQENKNDTIENIVCRLKEMPSTSFISENNKDQSNSEISRNLMSKQIIINRNIISSNQIIDENIKTRHKKEVKGRMSILEKLNAIRRYEKGETLKSISSDFNVSFNTISYWIKNKEKLQKSFLKVCKHSIDENENEILSNLNEKIEQKITEENIFTKYGRSQIYILKKLKAIKRYENGESLTNIACNLNKTPATILYWIRNKEKLLSRITNNKTNKTVLLKRSNSTETDLHRCKKIKLE